LINIGICDDEESMRREMREICKVLSKELESSLPTIHEIEEELKE